MFAHTLVLSLSVAACRCKRERVAESFAPTAPNLKNITSFGGPPYGISVEWEPVEFADRSPSSGYKVQMWKSEMPPMFNIADDIWITRHRPEESLDAIPSTDPVVQIAGIYETTARFEGIHLDVDYQVRVHAFDRLQDGAYSNALGIKLLTLDHPHGPRSLHMSTIRRFH